MHDIVPRPGTHLQFVACRCDTVSDWWIHVLRGLFGWAATVGAPVDLGGLLLDDQDGCMSCIHSAIATDLYAFELHHTCLLSYCSCLLAVAFLVPNRHLQHAYVCCHASVLAHLVKLACHLVLTGHLLATCVWGWQGGLVAFCIL